MAFKPGLKIGEIINNVRLMDIFKCANSGGMRRSLTTNTLVIVADHTKQLYGDKWIDGVLHYTGMGKSGDQSLTFLQNKTLAQSRTNGVDVHLFEVKYEGQYIYRGQVKLVGKPYQAVQHDDYGYIRKVWIFPVRPLEDNNVEKEIPEAPKPETEPIPSDVIGKRIKHEFAGIGEITAIDGKFIIVKYDNGSIDKLDYWYNVEKEKFNFI